MTYEEMQERLKRCSYPKKGDANRRWEEGVDHEDESVFLVLYMRGADVDYTADIRVGGDGDNGEDLMYLLDCLFEKQMGQDELLDVIARLIFDNYRAYPERRDAKTVLERVGAERAAGSNPKAKTRWLLEEVQRRLLADIYKEEADG